MAHPRRPAGSAGGDFLTDDNIRRAIQHLVGRGEVLRVAVAYWGKDGAKHTGIAKRAQSDRGNVQIMCDLNSGACNPSEIRELQNLGIEVKTLDHLHAKVWIGETSVILGSANASTSGLADERQLGSNIEAALLVQDPMLAQILRTWFDSKWCDDEAVLVDEACLLEAEKVWKQRRKVRRARPVRKPTEPTIPTTSELAKSRRRLVSMVADAAAELWRTDQSPDITLRAVRICQGNPDWLREYHAFVGLGSDEEAKRKRKINPLIGRNVRERIHAKVGKSGVIAGESDVIGSYSELHPDV